eukprot:jgi/Mesen1/107/ME1121281C07635
MEEEREKAPEEALLEFNAQISKAWREEDLRWRAEDRQWRADDVRFREEERKWFQQEQLLRESEKLCVSRAARPLPALCRPLLLAYLPARLCPPGRPALCHPSCSFCPCSSPACPPPAPPHPRPALLGRTLPTAPPVAACLPALPCLPCPARADRVPFNPVEAEGL